MRHRVAGKKLSRSTSHRIALRRNLAAGLIQHGAIRTTLVKAKELRSFVEHLITIAKKGTLHARRQVLSLLNDRMLADNEGNLVDAKGSIIDDSDARNVLVKRLFDEVAPKYANRPGGYTRIIKLAERRIGDSAPTVLMQFVEETSVEIEKPASRSRRRRLAAKRKQAASASGIAKSESAAEKPAEQAEEKKE